MSSNVLLRIMARETVGDPTIAADPLGWLEDVWLDMSPWDDPEGEPEPTLRDYREARAHIARMTF